MKRFLTTAAFLAAGILGMESVARADHDDPRQAIHRDFQLQRSDLERAYRAQRESLDFSYRRARDQIFAERDRVLRHHCDSRAEQLRAINLELVDLSREVAHRRRDLSTAYRLEREQLHNAYIDALRQVDRHHGYEVAVAHSVGPHPADCGCSVCSSGARIAHHAEHPRAHHRSEFDWAGLVISLLGHRLGH